MVDKVLFWNMMGIISTLTVSSIAPVLPKANLFAPICYSLDGLINSFAVTVMFEDVKSSKWF